MKLQPTRTVLALAMLAGAYAQSAQAVTPGVYFTEVLTLSASAPNSFFIEITNLSGISQSLFFDDSSRGLVWDYSNEDAPQQVFSTSATLPLPSLANGQSLIITNLFANLSDAASLGGNLNLAFTNYWNLPETSSGTPATVKVVQVSDGQFGTDFAPNVSGDELNLYDGSGNLVSRLTYNSNFSVSGHSRQVSPDALSQNVSAMQANQWTTSTVNDMFSSYQATLSADIGNPGFYDADLTAVPEPETYAMMLAGIGLIGLMVRRRKGIARIYA